jgi:hypothetical protein
MGLFKNNFNLFGAWVYFKANHTISKKEKEKRIVKKDSVPTQTSSERI